MKICLDAGHYGKYNSSPAVAGYYESEMSWKLHLMLKSALEQYGIEVITTRTEQAKDLNVYYRGKAAEGCDLLLSLHSNAVAKNAPATPDHPIVYGQISGAGDVLAEQLTSCIARVMNTKESGKVGHREGKNGDYYGVLRGAADVGVTALLVEHSFHTNEAATKWLMIDENLQRLANEEAAVIANYYGLQKLSAAMLYRVQVGAFAVRENAEQLLSKLQEDGYEGFITQSVLPET